MAVVELVSLTIGAIVAALVAKAADKGEDAAVKAGAGLLSRVGGWLRDRFTRDGDVASAAVVSKVEEVPDSPSRIAALAATIDQRADADPSFRGELEQLIEEAKRDGVRVESIAQSAWGNQNVQNAHVEGSMITVSYGTHTPPPAAR